MSDSLIELEKEKLRAEARVALLGFYKDELVSHATILLTLALITFTAMTTWELINWPSLHLPTALIAVPIGVYQVCRYLVFARMASYTTYAAPFDKNRTKSGLGFTGEDPIYEATDIYAISLRVDQLASEIPLEARKWRSELYRDAYLFAHLRARGTWRERLPLLLYGSIFLFGTALLARELLLPFAVSDALRTLAAIIVFSTSEFLLCLRSIKAS